jgi:nicotinamide-nucleotide amidase
MLDSDKKQATLEELASQVGDRLVSRNESLATAESCTGGWVSMLVTAITGSSAWFDRGFVSYSNEAKQEMLAVDKQVIEKHGAVSEETARSMVQGAIENSNAQVGLSITGIAGPGGGTIDKPVGTVCFGWMVDGQCDTETCHFSGDRNQVREQSVRHVLTTLLDRLQHGGARG